ncbi:Core-2/I-Branching enzyme [Pedobacter westerhofensis]|uniref:Peptide O-xylosyltransferase n=1 Tax=Pedobacter westerhofensis TaxID=425512 RepID=A0A521FGZ5_9SPHI|nr:beta-1,6-N-acetylglucosaminyltransferase [Pedobacter westerhofensis]SMO95254.1 Core-2/I-Branching enzyme [Pedobacter westerhofensis]
MRVAHLILTYTNPAQTERMIRAMWHKDFDFYIHVDKKFDITPHLILANIPNVYFIQNRIKVNWGGFSTIATEFEGIKEIIASGTRYSFINLLSGQGYPLRSPDHLARFFSDNAGKEFLSFYDYKNQWPEGMLRIEQYCFSDYSFKGKYTLERLLTAVLPKRKLPYHMHPYGKSMFWMLSPEAAMYVVKQIEGDTRLKRFFAWSWASDEFLFPTILMNSPYRDKIVNNNYRYIDWSEGGANPRVLDLGDFDAMMRSDNWWARKFDAVKSAGLMDKIDEVISTGISANSL